LDGVIIPSTDAGSRGVDLSMFSINSLAGIEVTKALTSDMDADAIAGAVNLITKEASGASTGLARAAPVTSISEGLLGVTSGVCGS
jgi:outer membrane cobalamin receptor